MMSVDLVYLRIAMLQFRSDVACSLTLNEVPGNLDLYVYLNTETAILLFNGFPLMRCRVVL